MNIIAYIEVFKSILKVDEAHFINSNIRPNLRTQ